MDLCDPERNMIKERYISKIGIIICFVWFVFFCKKQKICRIFVGMKVFLFWVVKEVKIIIEVNKGKEKVY